MSMLLWSLITSAFACSLGPQSPWLRTKEEFVKSAPKVVIAEVESAEPRPGQFWLYTFSVRETLRGPERQHFTLKTHAPPPRATEPAGRTIYDTACQPYAGFSVGRKYLMFIKEAHAFANEPLADASDPWLAQVRAWLKP